MDSTQINFLNVVKFSVSCWWEREQWCHGCNNRGLGRKHFPMFTKCCCSVWDQEKTLTIEEGEVLEGVKEDKPDIVWWLGDFFGLSLFYSVFGLSCINFSFSRSLLMLFINWVLCQNNCLWSSVRSFFENWLNSTSCVRTHSLLLTRGVSSCVWVIPLLFWFKESKSDVSK